MSMLKSRRSFVLGSAATAISTGLLSTAVANAKTRKSTIYEGIQDPLLKEIIQTALNSATDAGASYADARLSHREAFQVAGSFPTVNEHMAFGVRVLVDGYWGFASSPTWSTVEAVRLGRAAVTQAKANVIVQPRNWDIAPMVSSDSGHWTMPVKDDPFKMAYEEIWDFQSAFSAFVSSLKFHESSYSIIEYVRTSKAFGSSSGQYTTQILYKTGGPIGMSLLSDQGSRIGGGFYYATAAGLGFEHLRDQPLRDRFTVFYEDLLASLSLPINHLEVGRYDTLCPGDVVASLTSKTVGRPTEVDTAFGFEANAGGVGFIDPIDMLGSFKLGSNLLNVTGDRSANGSVGKVRWDDEGVAPVKVDLIRDGLVVNMQCNREGAAMLKDHFSTTGQVCQSHGCAYTPSATDVPMVHNMDLSVRPEKGGNSLDSLRSSITKGIELQSPYIDVDFQCITGFTMGTMFEIKNGKRIGRYLDGSVIFKTPELWNNLIGLGGEESVMRYGIDSRKGQPVQSSTSSVFAVPAVFKELTVMRTR